MIKFHLLQPEMPALPGSRSHTHTHLASGWAYCTVGCFFFAMMSFQSLLSVLHELCRCLPSSHG